MIWNAFKNTNTKIAKHIFKIDSIVQNTHSDIINPNEELVAK